MVFLGVVRMPFYYGSKVRLALEYLPAPTRHQAGRPGPPARAGPALTACKTAGVPESSGNPTFVCPAGTITGYVDRGVHRATGIRYARADRFSPPQPEPPATAPILAGEPGPACPQAPVPMLDVVLARPMRGMTYDEHCQRLSVTLPADAGPEGLLPVMVWVHGGSYTSGAGDAPIYDARALVTEQRVVVVHVTYRLGLFGFLGSSDGRPANLGLLDLVEALRWVRRNIAGFGGDPNRVTLFGQSAGGDAIAHLMLAEGTRGLFRRAIIQSPPLGIARGRARMSAAMAEAAAEIEASATAAEVVAAETGVAARAAPFRLLAAMPFGTQYGHPPLPAEDDLDEAWSAVAPHVDLLIGWTSREVALFAPEHPLLSRISPVPVVGPAVRESAVALLTRRVHSSAIRSFARRHARAGGRASTYVLSWGAPGNPYAGAHTVELPLLFGDEDTWRGATIIEGAPWSEVDRQGRVLRRLWADFARTGRVQPGRRPGLIRVLDASTDRS